MLGKTLNQLRKNNGFTAQQMADMLGVKIRTYRNYESEDRYPSYETLIKIADILGVSLDDLFGRKPPTGIHVLGTSGED